MRVATTGERGGGTSRLAGRARAGFSIAYKSVMALGLVPNRYRTHIARNLWLLRAKPGSGVSGLTIETASICNAKCTFCPYPKVEFPKKLMSDNDFDRVADLCGELQPGKVDFTPYLGEALVDPRIFDRVARVREIVPQANLQLTTNGTLVSPGVAARLLACGLNEVHVSFGSWGAEEYKALYGIDAWLKVYNGVRSLLEARRGSTGNVRISLWFRTIESTKLKKNPEFQKLLSDFGDVIYDYHVTDTYHDMPWISGMQPKWLKRESPIRLKVLKKLPCKYVSRITAAAAGGYFSCGCAASDMYRGKQSWFHLAESGASLEALRGSIREKLQAWHRSGPPEACQVCPLYTPADVFPGIWEAPAPGSA